MSNSRKYSAIVSPRDLNEWLHQVATHHGLQVEMTLRPSYQKQTYLICDVKLYEVARLSLREPIKVGQCFVAQSGEGQWGQMLNLAYQVLRDYQGDPWNWTARDRIREALEAQAGPDLVL